MTFKDIADTLISNNFISDLSLSKISISLFVTFLISLWIFFTYKRYTQDEFYSKKFNISLALMPIITTSIILAMQSNLVISLGMVGALSIVRYRTAIKSSLDLFFMFWAISVGIICGAGQYLLAILMTLFVTILLSVLSRFNFSKKKELIIVRCDNVKNLTHIEADIKKSCSFAQVKSKQVGSGIVEIIFECRSLKGIDPTVLSGKEYVKDFRILSSD